MGCAAKGKDNFLPGKSVTTLSDTNIEAELADPQVPHGIFQLGLVHHDGS